MAGGYFYNTVTGNVAIENGLTGLLSDLEAKLPFGPWKGPFATFADVQAYASAHHDPAPQLNESIAGQVGSAASTAAAAAGSTISGTLLGPLFQKNLGLRVGEFLIGLVLLAIGVNALFKGAPLKIVTNPVGAVARAVPT